MKNKFVHVENDTMLLTSELIVLTETWLEKNVFGDEEYQLEGYK